MLHIQPLQPDQWLLFKEIRCAALADAPYAFTRTLASVLDQSDEDWAQLARERANDPRSVTYFAYCDSEPCGMAGCILQDTEPVTAQLIAVWVKPAYRRHRAGAALIDYAKSWARENSAVTLYVGVTDSNRAALDFYYSHGFIDTGKRTPYKPNPDWLTMELAIGLA